MGYHVAFVFLHGNGLAWWCVNSGPVGTIPMAVMIIGILPFKPTQPPGHTTIVFLDSL